MLISGAETEKVSFSQKQQTNTANFTAWKDFIEKYSHKPRITISLEERKKMTEAEWRKETKLGRWAHVVEQNEKGNSGHTTLWQYPRQAIEFAKILQETPNYWQKNNTDDFNAYKEFIEKHGYKPRETILKEKQVMSEAEWQKEMRLGQWARVVGQNEKGNSGNITSWQFPEQAIEFAKIWQETPNYWQKNNTDDFNAYKEFIEKYSHTPRTTMSKKEKAKMTEIEWREELRLGRWANRVDQNEKGNSGHTTFWQYPRQAIEFTKVCQETPTYNQKIHTELLIKFIVFCDKNKHRPRNQTEKQKANSYNPVSREEVRLAQWSHSAHMKTVAWQYPREQQAKFDEVYAKYPNWRNYMKRQGLPYR